MEKSCARSASEAGWDSENTFYYSLSLSDEKSEMLIGIAVIKSSKPAELKNELVSVDLNDDSKDEYFRVCTSMEGLHLTIWTGKPLKGNRIWHSYYYLPHDAKPNCTGTETEDISL